MNTNPDAIKKVSIFRPKLKLETVLDQLIAHMLLGRSLRGALRELADRQCGRESLQVEFAKRVGLVMEGRAEAPRGSPIEELVRLERMQNRILPALMAWRNRLRLERHFRERVNQVQMQSRTQALLAGLIYLAAIAFAVSSGDLARLGSWLWLSLIMFFAGQLALFRMGREVRWSF